MSSAQSILMIARFYIKKTDGVKKHSAGFLKGDDVDAIDWEEISFLIANDFLRLFFYCLYYLL